MKKPSFFSRLTGGESEYDDYFEDTPEGQGHKDGERHIRLTTKGNPNPQMPSVGELAVDVYQTPDSIIVKALIPGVQPGSIDISLTREMMTVSGSREDEREVEEDGYFQRELYWGAFSRTVLLPEEVDVDGADAQEKYGVLTIRLPKINKKRETKLKVKSK